MANTKIKIGQGTVVSLAPKPTGNTAPAYTVISAKSVQLASIETAQVEITDFASNGLRQYIPGLRDASEASVSGNWDAGQAQDLLIAGFQSAGTVMMMKVDVPNSSNTAYSIVYTGTVSKYDTSIDFEGAGEYTMTMRVSAIA